MFRIIRKLKIYLTKKKKKKKKDELKIVFTIKYIEVLKNEFSEIIKFQNTRKLMDIRVIVLKRVMLYPLLFE